MKALFFTALVVSQMSSAFASRTPYVYCISNDQKTELRIFNDTYRGPEAEVSVWSNGTSSLLFSNSAVLRKDSGSLVNYLGSDLGVSIDRNNGARGPHFIGLMGTLNLASRVGEAPIYMVCKITTEQ